MRHHPIRIEAGDVLPIHAATRLGLTAIAFQYALPELIKRGFPEADATTGNFDLQAIDEWRRQRHSRLYSINGGSPDAVISDRIRQFLELG